MIRFFCLIVVFMSLCTVSFSQETGWQIIDTVRVSGRVYKVSVNDGLYIYENTRDSLRHLPDNVDWRYLGDNYPVYPSNYDEMVEKLDTDELDALVVPALSVNSDFIAIANIGASDC